MTPMCGLTRPRVDRFWRAPCCKAWYSRQLSSGAAFFASGHQQTADDCGSIAELKMAMTTSARWKDSARGSLKAQSDLSRRGWCRRRKVAGTTGQHPWCRRCKHPRASRTRDLSWRGGLRPTTLGRHFFLVVMSVSIVRSDRAPARARTHLENCTSP